jgi:hypothetical protein
VALRSRVLADVKSELAKPELAKSELISSELVRSELAKSDLARTRHLPAWRFAAAIAVTLLVGLGFSLCIMQTTAFGLQRRESPLSLDEIAMRLQQLSPGLSRQESLRQAALRQIGVEANGQTPLGDVPCSAMPCITETGTP